jgi:hypothetical protein
MSRSESIPPGTPREVTQNESVNGIDIIGNAMGIIIPKLNILLENDKAHAMSEPQKTARDFFIRNNLVTPIWGDTIWGDKTKWTFYPTDHEPRKGFTSDEGMLMTGTRILDESASTTLVNGVVISTSSILAAARNPTVKNHLLIGENVLGPIGHHHVTLTKDDLDILTNIADGVRNNDIDQIMNSLIPIDEKLTPPEKAYLGNRMEEDTPYRKFGNYAEAAEAIDQFYFPELQGGKTINVDIQNSVVYGRSSSLVGVLGGEVSGSIIAGINQPFANAHVTIINSFILTEKGPHYIEDETYGDPKKAKAAVEAARDLASNPLLAFAAAA